MEVYADIQGMYDVAQILKNNYARTEYYQAESKKHESEQLLACLDRALKKSRSCESLVKYNFDAQIESLRIGVITCNAQLLEIAEFIGLSAAQYDSTEHKLISRLNGDNQRVPRASTKVEDDDFHGITINGIQIGFRGAYARGIWSALHAMDASWSIDAKTDDAYQKFSTGLLDVGAVFVIGSKDNQLRIPLGLQVLTYNEESALPGAGGNGSAKGAGAGGGTSFTFIGASVGVGRGTEESTADLVLNPSLNKGKQASVHQYEVRDPCGYTGTVYTEGTLGVLPILSIQVNSSHKKHALDYD